MSRRSSTRTPFAYVLAVLAFLSVPALGDPYPPYWDNGTGAAIHFPPVAWPGEPADPKNWGSSCGGWLPYTRFQSDIADLRIQLPPNGRTSDPWSFTLWSGLFGISGDSFVDLAAP